MTSPGHQLSFAHKNNNSSSNAGGHRPNAIATATTQSASALSTPIHNNVSPDKTSLGGVSAVSNVSAFSGVSGISTVSSSGNMYTAIFDYEAQGEDELHLRQGQRIKVISKDSKISGDEGWWTGQLEDQARIGVFPANFVEQEQKLEQLSPEPGADTRPFEIDFYDIHLGELIGVGGFGKVFRGTWR